MAPTASDDSAPRAALAGLEVLGMPQRPFGSRTRTPNGAAPATFDQQAQQLLEAAEVREGRGGEERLVLRWEGGEVELRQEVD